MVPADRAVDDRAATAGYPAPDPGGQRRVARAKFPLTVLRTSVSTLSPQSIPPPASCWPPPPDVATDAAVGDDEWTALTVVPPPNDEPPDVVLPSTVLAISCSDPLL